MRWPENTIKASFVSGSRHTSEKSIKSEVVKFLGIDELSQLEPGAQSLLDAKPPEWGLFYAFSPSPRVSLQYRMLSSI